MEKFSKRLKELRLEKNFSQKKLADLLYIKRQSYARYESNTGEPSFQTLANLAKIFEVTVNYLLGLQD